MSQTRIVAEGITFDDVLLIPAKSDFVPSQAQTRTRLTNNITITPPDFYNYFKHIDPGTGNPRYEDQYADNLHPKGVGYQSMAGLWFDALTQ